MKKTLIIILAAMMAMPMAASATETSEAAVLTDKKPAKQKGEVKSVTFCVNLHCDNCVKKVQENIAFEKGVKDMKVSLEDQTVALKYDASKTSEETLKTAIEKLGYPVSGVVEPGHETHTRTHSHEHHHHHVK